MLTKSPEQALANIISKFKQRNAEDRARLDAWEAVTFPTKKDGTPFARMQQNISGAKIVPAFRRLGGISPLPCERSLSIFAYCAGSGDGNISDIIDIYTTAPERHKIINGTAWAMARAVFFAPPVPYRRRFFAFCPASCAAFCLAYMLRLAWRRWLSSERGLLLYMCLYSGTRFFALARFLAVLEYPRAFSFYSSCQWWMSAPLLLACKYGLCHGKFPRLSGRYWREACPPMPASPREAVASPDQPAPARPPPSPAYSDGP